MWKSALFAALLPLVFTGSFAQEFKSRPEAATVIELFTSEGCSSCPPADRWLSQFKDDPDIFSTLVPLAFHVDYWDYIGWKDPYAARAFSQRQRFYGQIGILRSVYTPGFVVNGEEWRDWFRSHQAALPGSEANPGVLSGRIDDNELTVSFASQQPLTLNFAYLGMGLSHKITAGENRNKTLSHDFVVLSHWQLPAEQISSGNLVWKTKLKPVPDAAQQETALVIWLTEPDSHRPVQATGTYLEARNTKISRTVTYF
ncbi:MAG: DUF1223 domain-containing protein [Reinekea sp.]|jgi:hypothetical protein